MYVLLDQGNCSGRRWWRSRTGAAACGFGVESTTRSAQSTHQWLLSARIFAYRGIASSHEGSGVHGSPGVSAMHTSFGFGICNEILDSLPDVKRFHVPLYSTRADVHDRIVGRMGAFDLVMRALDNLLARLAPRDVWISLCRNERCARGNRRIGTFCIGAGARISPAHALPQLRVASRSLLFCGA